MSILGSVIFHYISNPKRPSLDMTHALEIKKGLWEDYDSHDKEEMNVTCRDGYILHGSYIPGDGDDFVIITHGYSYNRHGSVKYANMYHKLGYHVYLYDLRYHGDNIKTYCSMGYNESRDIIDVANALYAWFGADISIGLHGESLGASSSMLACGMMNQLPKPFLFLVEDCGFADLKVLLEDLMRYAPHLSRYIPRKASDFGMKRYGFRFDEIRPMEAVVRLKDLPILFIHGKADDFILPKHCEMLYEAYQGPKQIYFCPGARHAQSFELDKKKYYEVVKSFLHHQLP